MNLPFEHKSTKYASTVLIILTFICVLASYFVVDYVLPQFLIILNNLGSEETKYALILYNIQTFWSKFIFIAILIFCMAENFFHFGKIRSVFSSIVGIVLSFTFMSIVTIATLYPMYKIIASLSQTS